MKKLKIATVLLVFGFVIKVIIPWQEIGETLKPFVIAFRWTLLTVIILIAILGLLHRLQTAWIRRTRRLQEPGPMIMEQRSLIERWRNNRRQGRDDL